MNAPTSAASPRKPAGPLRRGWTTGACATAASKAAFAALLGGAFPDPVTIRLPRGETPAFALCRTARGDDWAMASVVKDAGDDPDVTHRAEIVSTVRRGAEGSGVHFTAGTGRRHGDARRAADPARRAGDQSGAAQDDERSDC